MHEPIDQRPIEVTEDWVLSMGFTVRPWQWGTPTCGKDYQNGPLILSCYTPLNLWCWKDRQNKPPLSRQQILNRMLDVRCGMQSTDKDCPCRIPCR